MSSNDEETEAAYLSDESGDKDAEDILWNAISNGDARGVQQAIRNGADVNWESHCWNSPLAVACAWGHDRIVRILLNAGADARWYNPDDDTAFSAIDGAISGGLSTVELLLQHDNALLELVDGNGLTPLLAAVQQSQYETVQFLLQKGANIHAVDHHGKTALQYACATRNLEIVQLFLSAGVDVEARDYDQKTALHHAALFHSIAVARELILQHNANMFAVDHNGETPFDWACKLERAAIVADLLLELYGNKMTAEHGRLALHFILKVAEYSFAQTEAFHPPLNPLRIVLPLGTLTLKHWRILLFTLDTELIRHRDGSGKLPIHIACQADAPVDILAMLVEPDPTTLQRADRSGNLPLHVCCQGIVDHATAQYFIEQGGVGTIAARNDQGALPLHNLCASIRPPWRCVHDMIQSFPEAVTMRTHAGEYPFLLAAAAATDSSGGASSLSVVYELVRANPDLLLVPQ